MARTLAELIVELKSSGQQKLAAEITEAEQKLSKARKETEHLENAVKDADDAIKEWADGINEAGDELEEMARGADRAGKAVDGAGKEGRRSILEQGEAVNQLVGKFGALTAVVGGTAVAAFKLGEAATNAIRKLTETGEAAAARLIDASGNSTEVAKARIDELRSAVADAEASMAGASAGILARTGRTAAAVKEELQELQRFVQQQEELQARQRERARDESNRESADQRIAAEREALAAIELANAESIDERERLEIAAARRAADAKLKDARSRLAGEDNDAVRERIEQEIVLIEQRTRAEIGAILKRTEAERKAQEEAKRLDAERFEQQRRQDEERRLEQRRFIEEQNRLIEEQARRTSEAIANAITPQLSQQATGINQLALELKRLQDAVRDSGTGGRR